MKGTTSLFNKEKVNAESSQKVITLYHGTDHTLKKPAYGFGRADNDYGVGFYLTPNKIKAELWAAQMGNSINAIVNEYTIDLDGLRVINLDEYGVLAWIAEVAYNRGYASEVDESFSTDFINTYKVDTSDADLIVGYRADDSYSTVIQEFLNGVLSHTEVQNLFYKGSLGLQYALKSKAAFDAIKFIGSSKTDISLINYEEVNEREHVLKFIKNRKAAIVRRVPVNPITVVDAISDNYKYVKDGDYAKE